MSLPRWTIEDLKTRYSLEPSLNDVFVEGPYDKRILEICQRDEPEQRVVYEIQSVDVPGAELEKLGLTSGNKNRLIALAHCLSEVEKVALFLVDTDLDERLGRKQCVPGLVYTKFPDSGCALCDREITIELVCDAANIGISDREMFFEDISAILRLLFSIRLTIDEMGLSATMIEAKKSLTFKGGRLRLDHSDYCSRFIVQEVGKDGFHPFLERVEQWSEELLSYDSRHSTRFHDFTYVLAWFIRKSGRTTFNSPDAIRDVCVLLISRRKADVLAPLA